MVNLEAISPCADLLPLTIGSVVLTEVDLPERKVWSVSPCPVKPGTSRETKTSRTLWIGRDHGLQIGGRVPKSAVVTEQSDAWACVVISGAARLDVLARMCPLDLAKCQPGDVARSYINHLSAIIVTGSDAFEIFVFRAFARTLVHELEEAAKAFEARSSLPD